MFPVSYFPASYFAPTWFPPGAAIVAIVTEKFQGFIANVGRMGKR